MKKKSLTILCGLFLWMLPFTINAIIVNATTNADDRILIQNVDIEENGRIVEEGDNYIVYEKDIKADEFVNENENVLSLYKWAGYSLRNIKTNGTTTDYNRVVSSDDVSADSSFTFKVSTSATTSVSGVYSISAAEFNSKVGLNYSATVTVSKSNTTSCPKTLNGKKVKQCTVTFYPKYQKYKFDEYFLGMKTGSGTAKALVGFTQKVTYKF